MTAKLLAYHNDPAIKAKYVDRMRAHIAADELAHGATDTYRKGKPFKGCAVACTFNEYNHDAAPTEIGYPVWLSHLHDGIFESLSAPKDQEFALALLEAVEPGTDLEPVKARFYLWLLIDEQDGVIKYAGDEEWGVRAAILQVAALWNRTLSGETVDRKEWSAADAAAAAAAADARWSAADAAADAAAAAARWSAAAAARWSAAAAAADAAAAAADAAAAARIRQADKLIELLREASALEAGSVAP